jgi:SHS family lactate transporter-like MFS transporter
VRGLWAELNPAARKTFVACFLGWSLDAFDFFLLTFVVVRIAADFQKAIPEVAFAITLTLMCRPLGALLFGWFADRFGRRTPLMVDVALFSLLELATAFSPNFTVFLVLRALYGVAMGGEWGLGAAMAMEVLPPKRRGFYSGLLQEGYMVGYLLAALAYFGIFHFAPQWGWRGLFVIGTLPAILIFYIRAHVPESPAFEAEHRLRPKDAPHVLLTALRAHWPLFIYAILFMTSLNFLSHGTQDLYATSLQKGRGFDTNITTTLSVIAAFGAIAGGITFGALSQRFGRRACIMIAAFFGLGAIPLWAFSPTITLLAVGAFVMQFMVQGAWGVIPAHLNELAPAGTRGTFPGFTYQIGNLISAGAAQMEAAFATTRFPLPGGGADYGTAMAIIAAICFGAVFIFTALGYLVKAENRDSSFLEPAPD